MHNKPDLVQECIDLNLLISDLHEQRIEIIFDIDRAERLELQIAAAPTIELTDYLTNKVEEIKKTRPIDKLKYVQNLLSESEDEIIKKYNKHSHLRKLVEIAENFMEHEKETEAIELELKQNRTPKKFGSSRF